MDVEITEVPAMRLAYVRKDMTQPMEAWQELWDAVADPSALLSKPGVRSLAAFPVEVVDGGPKPSQRYDAAIALPEGEPVPAGLSEAHNPGGPRFARWTYIGPYDGMGGAWGEFTSWLGSSEHQHGTGDCFEMYMNDPRTTAPADLRTDLYIPLA